MVVEVRVVIGIVVYLRYGVVIRAAALYGGRKSLLHSVETLNVLFQGVARGLSVQKDIHGRNGVTVIIGGTDNVNHHEIGAIIQRCGRCANEYVA